MGWFKVIGSLLGLGGSLAGGWVERKKIEAQGAVDITKAKVEGKIRQVQSQQDHDNDWDKTQAENSGKSWKDEFWTIVLSIPLILCFIPGMEYYVINGFQALQETPEWYQILIGVAIAAAFGVKKVINLMERKQ